MPRFETEREHGSDWKVVDNMQHQKAIATGLDKEEAESLANQQNTKFDEEVKKFR